MKELLKNKRMYDLIKGYVSVLSVITPKDFFASEIPTTEKYDTQTIQDEMNKLLELGEIKEYGEVKGNQLLDFFKKDDFAYYLWESEDKLVLLNEINKNYHNQSQSYRFGYVLENGEITLLFNGDYVALSRAEALDLFPTLKDWVKNNVFGKATLFTDKMQ